MTLSSAARPCVLHVSALALAASLLSPLAPTAGAQESAAGGAEGRLPRKYLFAALGALVGAAASSAFLFADNGRGGAGQCSNKTCVVPLSVGAGGLVGYMVGREFDQLHLFRYRGGAPLKPGIVSVGVLASATQLAARGPTVAVGGQGGVQVVTNASDALRLGARRASGVRGISALDLAPGSGALAVGSQAGFYLYPPESGPGALVRDGGVSAIAAADDRIYVATGTRVEVVPAGADTTRGWPGIELGAPATALAVDAERRLLWAVVDSSLVALRPAGDSLERLSVTRTASRGLRLSVAGTRVAVALGEGGVAYLDVADPAAPRELGRWTGARFAYDVSLAGRRLYVASGVEGVYVLDTRGDQLAIEGLARELGFAIALASEGGYTFVLDRTTNSLRRIASDF